MINRRSFAAAGILATSAFGQMARAELRCTLFDRNGVQICTAGTTLGHTLAHRQECKNWCWAACLRMKR